MNIGMILGSTFPSDIRVEKEAGSLIKAGHQVHLLCAAKEKQPLEGFVNGIRITRIGGLRNFYQVGIWDVIASVNFIHPLFYFGLKRYIKDHKIDILHVHDLPLAKTAFIIGKKYGLPVVVDMHENYPEAIKVWFEWKKNPLIRLKNRIFFSYKRWLNYEKYVVKHASHVIAVVEEMKNRLVQHHDADPEKITVITNAEYKSFKDGENIENIYGSIADKFIIAYTGNVGPHRGVDSAIEAMQYVKELPVVLAIVGQANKAVNIKLEELIEKYQLKDNVKLYGYQPFYKFLSFMKQANVNLIPHHSNLHTDNTIPHKLFQCLQVERPLLVSSSAPLKRVVEETSSGLVFEAGNPEDLAEKIRILNSQPGLNKELARNGYLASQKGPYNWESTEPTLHALYEKLTKNS
jgi:glycosyltransferase involved in cell wall biosynthesis